MTGRAAGPPGLRHASFLYAGKGNMMTLRSGTYLPRAAGLGFALSRRAVLLLLLIFMTSCAAGLRPEAVKTDIVANPGTGGYINGVPFFPQKERKCGPAALVSVINYWGGSLTLDAAASAAFSERLGGTLPMDMLIYAKDAGFDAFHYKGSLDDLKRKVSENSPLILFLNVGYDLYPVGHYIVVLGYNDRLRVVLAHSDMDEDAVFTYDELLDAWGKTNYSTFLIKPVQPSR